MSAIICRHSVGHVGLRMLCRLECRCQALSRCTARRVPPVMKPSASYGSFSRVFESVVVSRLVTLTVLVHSCHTRFSMASDELNCPSSPAAVDHGYRTTHASTSSSSAAPAPASATISAQRQSLYS